MPTLMIIEDDPANRELLIAYCRTYGYDVESFPDAEQALATLPDATPDIFIVDLLLPGMNGVEFTRQVKADPRTAHIPVIAITASQGCIKIEEIRTFDYILYKPVRIVDLGDLLASLS